MALCNQCAFYSESVDNLNRDFNDIGNEDNHYCPMYNDAIPDGVYNGVKDCEYYEEKGERA
jgi:hypothetical protein